MSSGGGAPVTNDIWKKEKSRYSIQGEVIFNSLVIDKNTITKNLQRNLIQSEIIFKIAYTNTLYMIVNTYISPKIR